MFYGCTSLTTAPTLPATGRIGYCYREMFYGCSKLNYIKAMYLENYGSSSGNRNWVYGVAKNGTFVRNKKNTSPPVYGVNGIPEGWTVITE